MRRLISFIPSLLNFLLKSRIQQTDLRGELTSRHQVPARIAVLALRRYEVSPQNKLGKEPIPSQPICTLEGCVCYWMVAASELRHHWTPTLLKILHDGDLQSQLEVCIITSICRSTVFGGMMCLFRQPLVWKRQLFPNCNQASLQSVQCWFDPLTLVKENPQPNCRLVMSHGLWFSDSTFGVDNWYQEIRLPLISKLGPP